ncbi:hypothetical protein OPV22_029239 [Ensete ventricosum]|uniref:Endoplasmic reticulum transmembrane protein n=1 Tax=Ensete ventricosum TaxID=4639 RepID=A0AAV8Q0M1_ENSVE|nr:hypothetical protein OPV22_029239 [Ensete ventricosum]
MTPSLLFFIFVLELILGQVLARLTPAETPSLSVSPDRGEPGLLSPAALRLAQRHRTPDKSIAGAEVILGGFATVVFGAIFAYIRVTRKRSSDTKA